jgi:hypothetical protein
MRACMLLAAGLIASGANAAVYTDSTFDMFDNGFDNLDIASVDMSDDGVNLTIAVTTRGFQTWTKYMMYCEMYLTNAVSGNTVTWTVSLASLGVGAGQTIYFDIATSGGGNDPGVDHLSRSDAATPGWGTASTAGGFLSYTVVPTPGALALLGVAGLVCRRRR